jgi:type IV secretion system protein VirB8
MSDQDKKTKLKIKSWYSNRYQIVVVQRNILLLFTLISMFSVAVAVIFVKNIMSSKSLEPYVIEVEQKSGIATIVNQMTAQNFTGDQMIRQYFINQFICAEIQSQTY